MESRVKVIDCFGYNGEALALFRLAYLWDVVDEFIIVEAGETYAGQKKDALFLDKNAALLEPFAAKLTRLVIERFPTPTDAQIAHLTHPSGKTDPHFWFREKYQRNLAMAYLKTLPTPWVLLVCDMDEIPRRKFVSWLRRNYDACTGGGRLQMAMFYYSSLWRKPGGWNHAYVINDQGFGVHTLDALRVSPIIAKIFDDVGWHLSYFMPREQIQRKIQGFAHQEFNSEAYYDLAWVDHCLRTGEDLFRRGPLETCTRYDGTDLPEGLKEFERAHGIGVA